MSKLNNSEIISEILVNEKERQLKLKKNREYKRKYMRKWRADNKDKVKKNQERYILRKAKQLMNEQNNIESL